MPRTRSIALTALTMTFFGAGLAFAISIIGGDRPADAVPQSRAPDVPYAPSDPKVVAEMLAMANVHAKDVVYDLGCGDGRIVIAAVKIRGVRGVCIDIDPERIRESEENARRAGVHGRITFRTQDLFEAEIGDATVVMLFLWPEVNLKLRPKLLRDLRPGTRIVSHLHDMGAWKPNEIRSVEVDDGDPHYVFSWVMPFGERTGEWQSAVPRTDTQH